VKRTGYPLVLESPHEVFSLRDAPGESLAGTPRSQNSARLSKLRWPRVLAIPMERAEVVLTRVFGPRVSG
jgi:hypothetical protein